jgi:transcriptional regulator of arginine metabolism
VFRWSELDIFIHHVNTYSVSDKHRRQQRIAAAVRKGGVASQEHLADLLRSEGVEVTQATLSRDLRELGVMKGPAGYILPGTNGTIGQHSTGDLDRALRSFLLRGQVGGTLAVLHTGPGRAPLLALEIDRAGLKPVLGTIAGDDTIFVAARSTRDAARILAQFKEAAGL